MATPPSKNSPKILVFPLHLVSAFLLLILSLFMQGLMPGVSGDQTAAYNFVILLGYSPLIFLTPIVICGVSVLAGGRYVPVLVIMLIFSIVFTFVSALFELSLGIVAPLAYFAFSVWTFAQAVKG